MESSRITIDTHSLLWYVDKGQNSELSPLALQTITHAEENGVIYVPAVVLMETLYLMEKGRFRFTQYKDKDVNKAFDIFISMIDQSNIYQIVPVDASLIKATIPLKGLEIHDRLVFATTIMTNSKLVSKDRAIKARSVNLNVVW